MGVVFDQALLDTSAVIDYPAKSVAVHTASAAVSTITLAELAYGLLHVPLITRNEKDYFGIHKSLTRRRR